MTGLDAVVDECGFCGGAGGEHLPDCDPTGHERPDYDPAVESFVDRVRAGMAAEAAHRARLRECGPARSRAASSHRAVSKGVVHYEPLGRSAVIAAARAGLDETAYKKARSIVSRADEDPSRFGDLPGMAARSGIYRAFSEMRRRLSGQAAKSVVHGTVKVNNARAEARNLARALDGIVSASGAVSVAALVDEEDRRELAAAISGAVRRLNELRRALA